MSVLKLTSENFEKEVLQSEGKVLVDFYANWCGPCKMMAPIIDKIAEELEGKIKVGKIDIDNNQNIAMKYEIMSIPTIMIFENGKLQKTIVGMRDKSELINEINT